MVQNAIDSKMAFLTKDGEIYTIGEFLKDGGIMFRLTESFQDSMLGEALFEYMIVTAVRTVNQFSDRFLMLSKGRMTLQEFIEEDHRTKNQQDKG